MQNPVSDEFEKCPWRARFVDMLEGLTTEFESLAQENSELKNLLGASGVDYRFSGAKLATAAYLLDRGTPCERPWGPNHGRPPHSGASKALELLTLPKLAGTPQDPFERQEKPDKQVSPSPPVVNIAAPTTAVRNSNDIDTDYPIVEGDGDGRQVAFSIVQEDGFKSRLETDQEQRQPDAEMGALKTAPSEATYFPPNDLKLLRRQFSRLDRNGYGKVPLDHCTEICHKFSETRVDCQALGQALGEMQAQAAEGAMSQNSGEYMSFNQFLCLMTEEGGLVDDNSATGAMRRAFKQEHELHLVQEEKLAEKRKRQRMLFWVDVIPALVIILNAVAIGWRPDNNPGHVAWKVLDVMFLIVYTAEACIKCRIFGFKKYATGKERFWNWFDILCIFISGLDAFVLFADMEKIPHIGTLMLMKIIRLFKINRMAKEMRYECFDELKAMIFGVLSGVRVLFWAIVLLVIIISFLGVGLRVLIGHEHLEFSTVPRSMFTVFRCFTDGCSAYDGTPLQEILREDYGAVVLIVYSLTMIFIQLGLFNLICAIFIDNVVRNSDKRNQQELGESLADTRLQFENIFVRLILDHAHDNEETGALMSANQRKMLTKQWMSDPEAAFLAIPEDTQISRNVFNKWLEDKEFTNLMGNSNVDTSNQFELFDVLDADMSGELGIQELIDGVMRMRGPVTKSDIISTRMKVRHCTKMVQSITESMGLELNAPAKTKASPVRQGRIGW